MAQTQPSYQLTSHPIGSIREIWSISWPLMLGLLSGSFMMFADRWLLAHYSAAAMNSSAAAGTGAYALLVLPLIIAAISEVFVGKYHGANQLQEVGKPVWQMVWFSLLTIPLFLLGAEYLPTLFFYGAENAELETIYFRWIIYFGSSFCTTMALMGFFVGIGHVKTVTVCTLLGNAVNVGLDILFIFGYGPFPEMGIKGAALATGLAQLFQTLFLLALFLKRSNRMTFGTGRWYFDFTCFKESLRIGTPAGLGRFLEIMAHFVFFRIVMLSGTTNFTIITVIQSFYLLLSFLIEGLSKGVSTVIANLLGGKQNGLIAQVLKSAITLHVGFSAILAIGLLWFSEPLLLSFFMESDRTLLYASEYLSVAHTALAWMCLFFLFDGFGWIFAGLLTASGDTKFLLYASMILNWGFYILPTYLLIGRGQGDASMGWMIIAFYAILTFLTYRWRYRSDKWLATSTSFAKA